MNANKRLWIINENIQKCITTLLDLLKHSDQLPKFKLQMGVSLPMFLASQLQRKHIIHPLPSFSVSVFSSYIHQSLKSCTPQTLSSCIRTCTNFSQTRKEKLCYFAHLHSSSLSLWNYKKYVSFAMDVDSSLSFVSLLHWLIKSVKTFCISQLSLSLLYTIVFTFKDYPQYYILKLYRINIVITLCALLHILCLYIIQIYDWFHILL